MYKRGAKGWAKHLDFILCDLLCISVSFLAAYIIRHGYHNPLKNPIYKELFIVSLMIDLLSVIVFEFYKNVLKRGMFHELIKKFELSFLIFLLITGFLFVNKIGDEYSRTTVILMAVIYFVLSYIMTIILKAFARFRMKRAKENAMLIVSSEDCIESVLQTISENNYSRNYIKGIVMPDMATYSKKYSDVPVVANFDTIVDYVKDNWVDEIFVDINSGKRLKKGTISELVSMGVTIHVSINSIAGIKQNVGSIADMPVISMSLNYMTPRQAFAKRFMDIVGGLIGCIFTGLIFIFIAPIIKIKSPGPVFFSQTRVGQNGKPFKLYKFRSMYLDAEERKKELMDQNRIADGRMFKLEFDPRIIGNKIDPKTGKRKTGIGEFIRKTSLDEFPQFFNVLKGDMSLVGTRPPLPDEVAKYDSYHKARLAAKPGVTGLWQVSGRSDIVDFEEVVKLDTKYINNWSFGLDLKILLKTFLVVFKKEGSM